MHILLIQPPFGAFVSPYISVATLAAWIRGTRHHARVLDANILFYRELLAPPRLARAREFAVERHGQLCRPDTLALPETLEYTLLNRALTGSDRLLATAEHLFTPDHPFAAGERTALMRSALRLGSVPHFPEFLDLYDPNFIVTYTSPVPKFSSAALLQAVRSPRPKGLLASFFESLLPEHLPSGTCCVGISVTFPDQIEAGLRCAAAVKQLRPDAFVLLGGAFISCHLRTPRNPELFDLVDGLVADDGETTITRLLDTLESAGPDAARSRTPGLIWRDASLRIRSNPVADSAPLASMPPPAYELFPLDLYPVTRKGMPLLVRLAKGCSWARCAFCRTALPLIRDYDQMAAQQAFAQLVELQERTGSRIINFTDDSTTPTILERICRLILENNIPMAWTANFRFSRELTVERARLFRQAGCLYVNLGLESYNDRLLRLMRKGITTALIDRVLSNLSWAGLKVSVYMIVGFPSETVAEAEAGFAAIQGMLAQKTLYQCMYHQFQVVPFSDVHTHPASYGIQLPPAPEGWDMDPPLFDFSGPGMSRREAFRLSTEFNRRLNPPRIDHLQESSAAGGPGGTHRPDFSCLLDRLAQAEAEKPQDVNYLQWLMRQP